MYKSSLIFINVFNTKLVVRLIEVLDVQEEGSKCE